MDKLITQKWIPALVTAFYVCTVVFCLLLAFRYAGDGRYYSPSGDFSIRLPGQWAELPVSFPDNDFSIFPQLLQDQGEEQLSLISAHWKYYEDFPISVSVRRIPKEQAEALIGKDSGLKEFWQYLQNYQLSSPIAPALAGFSDIEPDCTHSDLSGLSSLSDILDRLGLASQANNKVTETRYYSFYEWLGPYVLQVSAIETTDSYYIVVANGESDFMDIPPDTLEKAVYTIRP